MTLYIPMPLPSLANVRWHPQKLARTKREQRRLVRLRLSPVDVPADVPRVVTLTRIAPRWLDGDNLQAALKACRDAVADWLGVDDAEHRSAVTWRYEQERGAPRVQALRVEVPDPPGG